MRPTQKLEIRVGIVTCLLALFCFCISTGYLSSNYLSEVLEKNYSEIISQLVIWMSPLMVAVGAYFDATKRSNISLAALCIGGIIVVIISGSLGLFFFIWGGHLLALLLFCTAILSPITILMALKGRLESPSFSGNTE